MCDIFVFDKSKHEEGFTRPNVPKQKKKIEKTEITHRRKHKQRELKKYIHNKNQKSKEKLKNYKNP